MDILLSEWGCASGTRCRGILTEGFGMLRTICTVLDSEDCSRTVLVSEDLAREARYIGADNIVQTKGDPLQKLEELSPGFDSAFLIAPESHGTLLSVSRAIAANTELLSCPPSTIEPLSDKTNVYDMVTRVGQHIAVPNWEACATEPSELEGVARSMGFPCVFKPPDGTGSEGISIIRSPSEIKPGCARLKAGGWERAIVQEFIQGRHLSATFIARGRSVLPLSINTQSMSLSNTPEYTGGSCPYPIALQEAIWQDLGRIAARGRLEGLMGMDFVLAHESAHIMEINPRMTTSCIGLSRTMGPELADALRGPEVVPAQRGYAQWLISPLQRTVQASDAGLSRILSLPEVVSPPFRFGPFYMRNQSKVLICVPGDDSYELAARISHAKSMLAEMHIAC